LISVAVFTMTKSIVLAVALALGCSPLSAQFVDDRISPAAVVRIQTPEGLILETQFAHASDASVEAALARSIRLPDGRYKWQIIEKAIVSPALLSAARTTRGNSDALPRGWPEAVPVRFGVITLTRGVLARGTETESSGPGSFKGQAKDVVFGDDLIVNGGSGAACFGLDCVNGEAFGLDSVRLKENNLRISFIDTSTSASFPSRDWELAANDSSNGGANDFSIRDRDQGTKPFVVEAAVSSNTLYVAPNERIGVGTNIPVRSVHALTGDTPGIRLEQSASLGFPAQTWDITGNEVGLTFRDQSNNTQPLRVRPGAPNDAVVVAANGSVGLGIAAPTSSLEVAGPTMSVGGTNMVLDAAGNLTIAGTVSQGSSRTLKEGIVDAAAETVLETLASLPIYTWQYIGASDRHIGPVAEEFHQAFGFGSDPERLAPGDMAGVAMAAAQALQTEVAEKEARINELEARLAKIEALLESRD